MVDVGGVVLTSVTQNSLICHHFRLQVQNDKMQFCYCKNTMITGRQLKCKQSTDNNNTLYVLS